MNKNVEPPRLFGLIIMASKADAEKCINALNNSQFEGRTLTIKYSSGSAPRNSPRDSPSTAAGNSANTSLEETDGNSVSSQPHQTNAPPPDASSPNVPLQPQVNPEQQNKNTAEVESTPLNAFSDNERAVTPPLPVVQHQSQRARRGGRNNFASGGRIGANSTPNDAVLSEAQAGDALDERVVVTGIPSTSTSNTAGTPTRAAGRTATLAAVAQGDAGASSLQITISNSEPKSNADAEEEADEPLIVDISEPSTEVEAARLVDPLGLAEGAFPPLHEPDAPPAAAAASSCASTEQKQTDKKEQSTRPDAAAADRERNRSGAAVSTSDRERDKDRRSDRGERGREKERERSRERESERSRDHAHRSVCTHANFCKKYT